MRAWNDGWDIWAWKIWHERYTAPEGMDTGAGGRMVEKDVQSGYGARRDRDEDGDWGTERERADIPRA